MNTAETDGKAIEGRKRVKISPYEELNNCLIVWFKQMVARQVPVGGDTLKTKALDFAEKLKIEDFKASNGE